MTDPWLRKDDESEKAFQAFVIYRDLRENRSYLEVSKLLGKNRKLIERWGKQHDWIERVAAFDRFEDVQQIRHAQKEIQEMYRNHRSVGGAIMGRVAQELKLLPKGSFKPRDIAILAKIGSEIEEKGLVCGTPELFSQTEQVEFPQIKYIEFRQQKRKPEDLGDMLNENNS